MATPLTIERAYAVQGPDVVARAKVDAQGAVQIRIVIGDKTLSAVNATAYANAILTAVAGSEDLQAQAAALWQRG